MFEQNNNFSKGLIKDFNQLRQPENSYYNMLNFVKMSDTGDYYSITNEKGNEIYCVLPSGFSIIGRYVLEKDIIVFLHNTNTLANKICTISTDASVTTNLDDPNNELNLDIDHPIDCTARTLINSHRIVYFTDNKNPVRTIDLDSPPAIGVINKLASLIPESIFSIVTDFNVKDSSSSLKCGAYQFAFRYLDNKGNYTNISLPSPLVSIGQDSFNPASSSGYQGGYSDIDSNKAIEISLSNIDQDYFQIEIIAIYYKGLTATLTTEICGRLEINNTTSSFIYTGQFISSIATEEVLGLTTNYSTAKCIEQKDNRLFISNLKEEFTDVDLQAVANGIQLYYNIEEFDLNTTSYKDPDLNAFKVGYKRGEVYSFGFGVIFKNGAKSFVFHIPAPVASGTSGTIVQYANTTTKLLGTYLSTIQYPSSIPSLTGDIRYHVMPRFDQELPYDPSTNTIRTLSVKPIFTVDLPSNIKDQIQGIFIVRRTRDSSENRSIFSQGISNYMMDMFQIPTDDKESGSPTHTFDGINFGYYEKHQGLKKIVKTPMLGGIRLNWYLPVRSFGSLNDPIIDASFYYPTAITGSYGYGFQTTCQPLQYTFISQTHSSRTSATHGNPSTSGKLQGWKDGSPGANNGTYIAELYKDLLVFYSTESILDSKMNLNFTQVRRVGSCTFDRSSVRFNRSVYADIYPTELTKFTQYYEFYFQNAVFGINDPTLVTVVDKFYVDRNSSVSTTFGIDIDNTNQEGFLYINTNTNTFADSEQTFQVLDVQNNQYTSPSSSNDTDLPNPAVDPTESLLKNILELYSTNTAQYGSIPNQNYVVCNYLPYDGVSNINYLNSTLIYGGDTYINRVAFSNKTPIKTKPLRLYGLGLVNKFWEYPEDSYDDNINSDYIDIRSLIYFYVESDKNADLRHALPNGNLFYPKGTEDTVLKTKPNEIPDAVAYNNQYDYENSLITLSSKPEIFDSNVNHYKTRTIWSEQAITGELQDSYRIIKINNFYDIQFNTGEIWDTFVYNNTFYLHTPKALWRTFVNSIEQQSSTTGQVVLGTGGVFPSNLPPQQILTQQGGYAGTISQWGGTITPFGYIFPDSLQGKVFKLGDSLEEISLARLTRYFNDNLSVLDNNYNEYIDNPFKYGSKGLLSVYDNELKRYILTKNHPTNSFTISYDPLNDTWLSFHSYRPNVYISRDNDFYSCMNNVFTLYQHNKGNYGEYYGQVFNSELEYTCNHSGAITKVFDNIMLNMDSFNYNNTPQIYRNSLLDSIIVYDDIQSSGNTLISWNNDYNYIPNRTSIRGQFINKQYNLYVPLNAAVNDDINNINQNTAIRSRIKGNWANVIFKFNNTNNLKLVINQIITKFRKNFR